MLTLNGGRDKVSGKDVSPCSWISTSGLFRYGGIDTWSHSPETSRAQSFASAIDEFMRCSESDGFSTTKVSDIPTSTQPWGPGNRGPARGAQQNSGACATRRVNGM